MPTEPVVSIKGMGPSKFNQGGSTGSQRINVVGYSLAAAVLSSDRRRSAPLPATATRNVKVPLTAKTLMADPAERRPEQSQLCSAPAAFWFRRAGCDQLHAEPHNGPESEIPATFIGYLIYSNEAREFGLSAVGLEAFSLGASSCGLPGFRCGLRITRTT